VSDLYLRVRAGELHAALPAAAVRHVARALALAPLPGASGALLGLVEFGGEPLPVIDLARALGHAAPRGAAPAITVFAWIGAGAERELVGLAVDEALDVAELPPEGAGTGGRGGLVAVDLEALGELR